MTEEDIKTIRSRTINEGTDVMRLNNDDIYVCYACAINKKQHFIVTKIISTHVDRIHPIVKPDDDNQSACYSIPRNTIILEGLVTSKEGAMSEVFHNYVFDSYEDADIK